MIMWYKYKLFALSVTSLVLIALLAITGVSLAQSSSTNYVVDEYSFGIGGELEACSASYCSKQTAGEVTVGNVAGTAYQSQPGSNTTYQPLLEVAVNGSVNFGILDTSSTATGTATAQVRTYLASGYNMIVNGDRKRKRLNSSH